tara:strand:+ start:34 stop:210 length:177 start_codon:yes stop_codon:yes gene_type:complete
MRIFFVGVFLHLAPPKIERKKDATIRNSQIDIKKKNTIIEEKNVKLSRRMVRFVTPRL